MLLFRNRIFIKARKASLSAQSQLGQLRHFLQGLRRTEKEGDKNIRPGRWAGEGLRVRDGGCQDLPDPRKLPCCEGLGVMGEYDMCMRAPMRTRACVHTHILHL